MPKVIRTYRIVRDVLYCDINVLPDDSDFVDDFHWTASGPDFKQISLSAVVGPSSNRQLDLKVSSLNCSRSLLLDEIIRFCSTIKQMYEL